MENSHSNNEKMVEGISQLLGIKPYISVPASIPCEHEDDGYVYDSTHRYITLHCNKCGVFYEQAK